MGYMWFPGFVILSVWLAADGGAVSALDTKAIQDQMQAEMKAALDIVSNQSGYSFSVGYVDVEGRSFGFGSGPRTPREFHHSSGNPSGEANGLDRFLIGSGTKSFTATAVMRLVDRGVVKLTDPASQHLDPSLKPAMGKSFVELFGAKAAKVQVKHLLQMQSGIADFDIPSLDHMILTNYTNKTISPFAVVGMVAAFEESDRFVCDPGTCTSYSSTNYVLAGFVLTTHSNATWETYRIEEGLGLEPSEYPTLRFPSAGHLDTKGNLSVVGISKVYGTAELYHQDASILGWTCGNAVTDALDVARFFFKLLGPDARLVSKESLAIMTKFRPLTVGWAKDDVAYGTGLMIQDVRPGAGPLPPSTGLSAYIGHGGDTYGFMSDNGWYPQLNASISVIVNEDSDYRYPSYIATCKVVEVAARYTGPKQRVDLHCMEPNEEVGYECRNFLGHPYCHASYYGKESKSECEKTCK